MRILTLLLAGLFFMTTSALAAGQTGPSPAAPRPISQPDPTTRLFKLPNGLTVFLKKDSRFPLVSVRLYVHAGSVYEAEKEAGLSHMLEHMVFKGTASRPKGTVSAEVESAGGYLNAATSFDYTVYVMDMPAAEWATSLDVIKDMAFNPTLDPAELESEKDVVVAELKQRDDEPGSRLFKLLQRSAMQGTPYAREIIGTEETIRSLTREMMRDYISRLYQPQGMLLAVVGDIDLEAVEKEAGKLFGPLKNTRPFQPAPAYEPAPLPGGPAFTVEKGVWNKVRVNIAFQVPGQQDMRSAQLDILAQLLGGDPTSRLYRSLKYEKRLVDGISVSNYSFERIGMFIIQATLDADKVDAFWDALCAELAGMQNLAFTQEELDRAKLNMEDELFRSKETIEGLTNKLSYFQFFDNGEQGEANYLQAARDTDQVQLTELMREFFSPERLAVAMLIPEKQAADLPSAEALKSRLLTAWKTAPAKAAHTPGKEDTAGTERIDLGQGRTLVLIPDATLPYVAVNLMYTGGDFLLTPETQGLGTFTASLLTKGNAKLSATQFEDFKADRAASFGAAAGKQSFTVSMNFPNRFTDDMFGLLLETLEAPAFAPEEAARVKENQLAFIKEREDRPVSLAFRRIFPALFGNHPYGFLQTGEADRVKEFTVEDAKKYWASQSPQPWVMAVCGDFDRENILAWAKKLPVPSAKAPAVSAPSWGKDHKLDIKLPGRNQAHLFMLFPTVGANSPDEAGMDLLQTILAGQSGLLFRDLRDVQGLGYTVTAIPWKAEKTGALLFYIATDQDKLDQAEAGFKKAVGNLQTSLLEEEDIRRGKNQMRAGYYRAAQPLGARSSEAAVLTLLGKPLDRERKNIEKAQSLTAKDLQALARKYLVLDKAYVFKVLP